MGDSNKWFIAGVLLGAAAAVAAVLITLKVSMPRCPACRGRWGTTRVPNRDVSGYHCRHCDRFFLERK